MLLFYKWDLGIGEGDGLLIYEFFEKLVIIII